MHEATLIGLATVVALAASSPMASRTPTTTSSQPNTAGFLDSEIVYSQGKHAVCVAGIVPVEASTSMNAHLNIASNLTVDQTTQIVLDLTSANASAFLAATTGANVTVGGTWNISSRLCFPVNSTDQSESSSAQVQLLTHGIAFGQSYWDFPVPAGSVGNYSYVDYAAQQNKITFTYDRLGIGASEQPDGIQVVQGPLEAAILHSLVTKLRAGQIGNTTFDSVVGAGHSYGSQLTAAVAKSYPNDFDAIILTGFTNGKPGGAQFTSALNLEAPPASAHLAPRGGGGYLVPTTRYGLQYSFFAYPDFENDVLAAAVKTVQPTTLGEQLTMARIAGPALNYTRPVYVLDGEKDLIFCNADCPAVNGQGQDMPAATLAQLFPRAAAQKSGTYILPGAGHGVNLAKNSVVAFEAIQRWIAAL